MVACTLLLLAGALRAEEAAELEARGASALKQSQAEPDAIISAAIYFGRAAAAYEQGANSVKVVEINAFLYWCKKKMTAEQTEAFLKGGNDAAAIAKRMKDVEALAPGADEANNYFERAESFAKAHPAEHLLISVRFFEVADRFKGSEVSLKAQDRSLQEMTQASAAAPADTKVAPAVEAVKKVAAPSAAQQKEAEKLVRELFKDEFAKTTVKDKQSLAQKLKAQSGQAQNDPAGEYAVLTQAAHLFAQLADLDGTLSCLDALAKEFEGDFKAVRRAELGAVASGTRDAAMMKAATALRTLVDRPDDPPSALTAGRYYCFVKNEYANGLPLLVKSPVASLSKVAKQELAGHEQAAEQVALGDAWWELAEKSTEKDEQRSFRQRAGYWYTLVLPSQGGLVKARIDKRIGAIAAATGIAARGGAIDLLKTTNTNRDSVNGEWRMAGGVLECRSSISYARYQFQTKLPAEYDIRFVFVRPSGDGTVGAMFTCAEQRLRLIVCGFKNSLAGLSYIDGKPADQNATKTPNVVENNKEYEIVVEVRKNSIRVVQNQKELFNYKFQTAKFTLDAGFGDQPLLVLYAHNALAHFKTVEIVPVTTGQ